MLLNDNHKLLQEGKEKVVLTIPQEPGEICYCGFIFVNCLYLYVFITVQASNMSSAKTSLLTILLAGIFSIQAVAQVQTARYISMIPHTNAYYEYVPQGYPEPNKKYPLMIFLHGQGEAGPGTTASLPLVLRNGPPKLISEGTFPASFTVNSVNYKIIVISPQFTVWPTEDDLDNVINYLIANYPVDINRVYLTGLSMGGGTVWNYSGNDINHANRVAAIVPVCGALSLSITCKNNGFGKSARVGHTQ
jgi:predicted alpha/beta-fold hydrolase